MVTSAVEMTEIDRAPDDEENYGKFVTGKAARSIKNLFTLFEGTDGASKSPSIREYPEIIESAFKDNFEEFVCSESVKKLKSVLNIDDNHPESEKKEFREQAPQDRKRYTYKQRSQSVEDVFKLYKLEQEKANIYSEENVLVKKQSSVLLEKLAEVMNENDRLKEFYDSQDDFKQMSDTKAKSLETQLEFYRHENILLSDENKQLLKKISVVESLNQAGAVQFGLCIKCSQEAVGLQDQEKLSRNDQLQKQINVLEKKLQHSKDIEKQLAEEMYCKIKLIEEAQLETTRAHIEKDRLKADLLTSQKRWEELLINTGQTVATQCQAEHQLTVDKLLSTEKINKELVTKLANLNEEFERCKDENKSLLFEVIELRKTCSKIDLEYNVLTGNMNVGMIHTQVYGNSLQQEIEKLNFRLNQSEQETFAARLRFKEEVDSMSRRLYEAEKALAQSRNEVIELQEHKQKLMKKIEYLEQSRLQLERKMSDTVKDIEKMGIEREAQIGDSLLEIQERHKAAMSQMEENLQIYKNLTRDLQNECSILIERLEVMMRSHRSDMKKVKDENKKLKKHLLLNLNDTFRTMEESSLQV